MTPAGWRKARALRDKRGTQILGNGEACGGPGPGATRDVAPSPA
jgi:hypothetical protein